MSIVRTRRKNTTVADTVPIALGYTRISGSKHQKKGISLEAQASMINTYIAAGGFQHGGLFTDILSGQRADRPEYQRLLERVRELRRGGHAVIVVVVRLDRLGRRVLESVRCREELLKLGVATHATMQGGEVSDFIANIHASVAQEEARVIGERVGDAWDEFTDKGWRVVSGAPFGYCWRDATEDEDKLGAPAKVLDIDPLAASHVGRAFTRFAAGASTGQITSELSTLEDSVRGGRDLRRRTVERMLSNMVYVGMQPDGRTGNWPAIVDEATWNAVQARRQVHQDRADDRHARGEYLLTSYLRCSLCGARMSGQISRRASQPTWSPDRRYKCGSGRIDGAVTPRCHSTVSAKQTDALVLQEIGGMLDQVTSCSRGLLERAWREIGEPPAQVAVERQRRRLQARRDQARQDLAGATRRLVREEIQQDAYDALCADARAELALVDAELAGLDAEQANRPALPNLAHVLHLAPTWAATLAGFDLTAQREVLAALVMQLTVTRSARAYATSDVTWTPLGHAVAELAARAQQAAA